MATPADQRLLELLDKWLKSLELHLKYSSLDDDTYLQMQPWPEHQRPSRWIIDLAKQKALALQGQIQDRVKQADTKFSDSLELMNFLANLLGAEHIERFIPLADADSERADSAHDSGEPGARGEAPASADSSTMTREMPKFQAGRQRAPAPTSTDQVVRTERKGSEATPVARTAAKPPAKGAAGGKPATTAKPAAAPTSPFESPGGSSGTDRPASPEAMHEQVIADAARLVQWGRKWYELAELISSMADRPSLTDVRRILKDNKTVIDKKAGRG